MSESAAWALRCVKASALREAAEEFDLFDSDYDRALVAAWLTERAEKLESK